MKAEERKRLAKNELADKLHTVWDGLSSNSPTATRVWTVILVVLGVALAWLLYTRFFSSTSETALWTKLDEANDIERLEEIAKDAPKALPGTIARYHITRFRFAEAVNKVADNAPEERLKAADAVEQVRKDYLEYKDTPKLPELLWQEALGQAGKAEELLASIPKADNAAVMRGSLDAALGHYDELIAKYPDSLHGKSAAKRAEDIRKNKTEIAKLNQELATVHGKPLMPAIPSLPPPAETPPTIPTPAPAPPLPTPTDTPKAPGETPKPPTETPKTPAETPKPPTETPKTPAETPKTPAEPPKG